MTLNPISIAPDASIDEAACVMDTHKISALPVVENSRVVGILTTTGILRAFVDLSGAAEPTTRIILSSKGGREIERKIRDLVHARHGEVKWIHRQGRHYHLRVKGRDVVQIVTALEAAGLDVTGVITSNERTEKEHRSPRGPNRKPAKSADF
jgi:acetoin utilization protein AcuB